MATHQDQAIQLRSRQADPVQESASKHQASQSLDQELAVLTQQINPGAIQRPEQATPGEILTLQRTVGNRTVSGLIQAKLNVGPAGDRYEQEADRIADHVMRTPAPNITSSIQRQEVPEEEELQLKPLAASITPIMQRQGIPEEEGLQLKKSAYKYADAPTDPDEYMEYLKKNPAKLSDKERELTGIAPSVSRDPSGYVKFLAQNQDRMSEKEKSLFALLSSQSTQTESTPEEKTTSEVDPYHDPMHPTMSPLVNKRPPDNSTPTPPSKWSQFKGQFSSGMKRRFSPERDIPLALRQQSRGTTGGLLQGSGVGTRKALSARPGGGWKQQFDEPEKEKGDSDVDKMIEKLKAQLEMLEKLKGGD